MGWFRGLFGTKPPAAESVDDESETPGEEVSCDSGDDLDSTFRCDDDDGDDDNDDGDTDIATHTSSFRADEDNVSLFQCERMVTKSRARTAAKQDK